jgi:hypothetical protein
MLGYNNMEKERAVKTNSVSEITKFKNVRLSFYDIKVYTYSMKRNSYRRTIILEQTVY